jgi:hypothetical protein
MLPGQVDVSQVAYRPRESPFPMISVDEAVAIVMEHAQILSEETINFTGIVRQNNIKSFNVILLKYDGPTFYLCWYL